MNALRMLIADDHQVVRLGLRSLVEAHTGWEVCGEAADGREAVEKCKLLKPDLLILDICMPALNGMDAARQILRANPNQRILIFTDVDSEQVIRECLEMGVRGWLWKSDLTSHFCLAVESLQNGRTFFTARVAELVLNSYLQRSTTRPAETIVVRLSPREREVLQLLSEGNTTKKIASMLDVTVKTAETHRSNIMRKLGIHSIAELVLYAVRNNIIQVQPTVPSLAASKPDFRRGGLFNQEQGQALN
jgi:DNA-binding NarL/FixJ family response regulator